MFARSRCDGSGSGIVVTLAELPQSAAGLPLKGDERAPNPPCPRSRRFPAASDPLDSALFLSQSGFSPADQAVGSGNGTSPPTREEAHVSRLACCHARRSAGCRHGRVGRDRHLSGARRAQQPVDASLARRGPQTGDHYAILMENQARFVECCAAGERSGLYFTCINSFLTPNEVAYIVNNSLSKVLITSAGEARNRARGLGRLSECRALPDRRGSRRRAPCAESRGRDG